MVKRTPPTAPPRAPAIDSSGAPVGSLARAFLRPPLPPLVDHGGKHNFVEWAAPNDPDLAYCRLPLNVHEPSAAKCPFYSNPKVIAAFKVYSQSTWGSPPLSYYSAFDAVFGLRLLPPTPVLSCPSVRSVLPRWT